MKLLTSSALTSAPVDPDALACLVSWAVTPDIIVLYLSTGALQARDWAGAQLWETQLGEGRGAGLAVGGGSIFIGGDKEDGAAEEEGVVEEYELRTGSFVHRYHDHRAHVNVISTAQDGDDTSTSTTLVIAGSADGSIQVWDAGAKTRRLHLTAVHDRTIMTLQVEQNVLVSTGWGPDVAQWDLATGKLLSAFHQPDVRFICSVVISKELMAAGGGGSGRLIFVFERQNSKLVATLNSGAKLINGLFLHRPDILVSTDTSGYVSLWSLATYARLRRVKVHEHSSITRTVHGDVLYSGGKEGGGDKNWCGIGCKLKSCDLVALMKEGAAAEEEENGVVKEHGWPTQTLWKVEAEGGRVAACLSRKGRPALEIWGLE